MAPTRDGRPAGEMSFAGGTTLIAALALLPSVHVSRLDRIRAALRKPLSVVMVGGMCSGKSVLAHGAEAHPELAGRCEVVKRCSTRESRQGDVADGVTSIGWEEFRARREAGGFALSWVRPLANGSSIGYGCMHPSGDVTPIFMAGHGVYTNKETVRPLGALDNALFVGVYAPFAVRAERLRLRSPDVVARGQATVDKLLAHDDDAMRSNVDLLVRNYGGHQAATVQDFARVLALILDLAG
jgi:ribose 1,5-bisphosphokinase PhnN